MEKLIISITDANAKLVITMLADTVATLSQRVDVLEQERLELRQTLERVSGSSHAKSNTGFSIG